MIPIVASVFLRCFSWWGAGGRGPHGGSGVGMLTADMKILPPLSTQRVVSCPAPH